jgi:hypothetical protein
MWLYPFLPHVLRTVRKHCGNVNINLEDLIDLQVLSPLSMKVFFLYAVYLSVCVDGYAPAHRLNQRWPTGGPRAGSGPQPDLHRPPPSHRFGSNSESFNICIILLVQRKI